jgi:transposase-like protein
MKLSYEDKIDIVKAIDNGISNVFELGKIYDKSSNGIYYIYDLYKRHGTKVLQQHYISHSIEIKETIVKRIKNGESGYNLGIEFGLSNAEIIYPWIKNYDENYGKILVNKRGRKMKDKNRVKDNSIDKPVKGVSLSKVVKDKSYKDLQKEIKELNRKLEYSRAEMIYLKKLDALVQARIKREQKIK